MSELEELKKKVDYLENVMGEFNLISLGRKRVEDDHSAGFEALNSIVRELAERQGIPPEEYHKHYIRRYNWWLDRSLRRTEDISPELAAELDTRPPESVNTDELYPPLFGESDQNQG